MTRNNDENVPGRLGGGDVVATDHGQINRAAEFLPQVAAGERPTVLVGGADVSAYWEDGELRISVGLEDVDPELIPDGGCVPIAVHVGGAMVYRADEEGNTNGLT